LNQGLLILNLPLSENAIKNIENPIAYTLGDLKFDPFRVEIGAL